MPWSTKRARKFLLRAAHDRAKGSGLSDTTLARIAGMQDPDAATSRKAFMVALTRAGWSRHRIRAALDEVTRRPAIVRWARRQSTRLVVGAPLTILWALVAPSVGSALCLILLTWIVTAWEVPARGGAS